MSKKENSYIHFIGSNSTDVTGSCNLVNFMGDKLLIDYGMNQTSNDESDYKINSVRDKHIKPKELKAIIVTHGGHL